MSLSRRDVLKLGVSATAATVMPAVFAKSNQDKPILVGKDRWTYEVHHDWLVPPLGFDYGDTHGIAQDAQGRLYLAQTVHPGSYRQDAVLVFDQEGSFITSWGSDFAGGAHGLDIRKEGNNEFIYHCDTRRRLLVKTTLSGEHVWERNYPKDSGVYPSEDKFCPTNVAFAPNGDVYLGDGYGSSYIHRYSQDGDYKGIIAKPGSGKGEVSCPHGLWVDDRKATPELYVADRSNRRIQRLSLTGEHLGFVTDGIRLPCHFKTREEFLLVPDLQSVVTILDKDDKPVVQLCDGDPSNLRDAPHDRFIPGKFIHPHSAIWVNKWDILVVEWVPIGRVTLLRNVNFQ